MKRLLEFLINNKSTGIIKINDGFVDLGLSVLWAKCNLGAKEPEDPGFYFQWGEPKGYRINDNFEFSVHNYDRNKYGEYAEIKSEDDAATQMLGPKCHMPSLTECDELISNTKKQFEDDGMRLYSLINDETIFIPFSKSITNNRFSKRNDKFSFLFTNKTEILDFVSVLYICEPNIFRIDGFERYRGCCIRPVKDK